MKLYLKNHTKLNDQFPQKKFPKMVAILDSSHFEYEKNTK